MRVRALIPHIATVIVSVTLSAVVAFAWTGPQNAPPNCVSGQEGCDAPINVGPTTQIKSGSLGILANLQLAGAGGSYLNFGATAGATGYGIRDNAGTLEFKSSGGSWTNLTNTVTNVLGIGAVSSIKFSDGTTQTTAAGSGATGDVQTFLLSGSDGNDRRRRGCWRHYWRYWRHYYFWFLLFAERIEEF